MFDVKKRKDSVIILGTGTGWERFPRNTDKTVYGLNDYVYTEKYQIIPDILFIMDVLDEKPQVVSGISNLGDVMARINQMKVPLIAPFKYEEIPLSQAFPIHECVKEFGAPYFTNTIAFMIAYALLQGVKEIELFGVNQASSGEYFYEKAGVEYWLGIAVGRGVKVTINGDKSEVLANKARFGGTLMYGYNQSYEHFTEAEKKFGEGSIKKLSTPAPAKSRVIREIN